MNIGDAVKVRDDVLGIVTGTIVGFNHEGLPLVSFNNEPAVIVFTNMVL